MSDGNLFSLVGIIICLAFSAFFSASETAFTSFNKTKMKTLATEGNKRASLVLKLESNYDKLLSTILVGNNIVNISMSSIATVMFVDILKSSSFAESAPAIATAIITVAVLIFGEISPKSLAKEHAEGLAIAVAPFLSFLSLLLTPINAIFMLWRKLLSIIFKHKEDDTVTESEVLTLVDEAHEDGSIDEYDKELIENIFDFDDVTAAEITTHRTELITLCLEDDIEEWNKAIHSSNYSRYPVYSENLDNIIGILDARAYLRLPNRTMETVKETIRSAYFVPESVKLDVLFRNMKQAKESLAVVLDEHGGTTGVVSITDVIECLVGEFTEAPEAIEEEPEFVQKEENIWIIRGDALISDVNKKLGTDIDETEVDTLSGYILGIYGEIPTEGSTFELSDERGIGIKVLGIKDRMVDLAEITLPAPEEEEEEKSNPLADLFSGDKSKE